MKFKIEGNTLKNAAALVDQAVDSKAETPDYSHVFLMTTAPDTNGAAGLYMCGFNGRYMVRVTNLPVTNVEQGAILIGASYWQRLVGECGGKTIEVDSDDTTYAKITLIPTSGKAQSFKFNILTADQYMALPMTNTITSCSVDKWHLKDALSLVRPAADSDNSIDILNGVCFEFSEKSVKLIATNASTLGYAEVNVLYEGGNAPTSPHIRVVPKDGMELLDKMITKHQGAEINISIADALVAFRAEGIELVTSLLAGGTTYPGWQRHVPDAIDGPTFHTTVGALTNAVSMAEIVNDGQPVSVDIHINNEVVNIGSQEIGGTFDGDIPCESVFGNARFRLDSKLVRDSVRALDPKVSIQLAPINDGRRVQVIPSLPNLDSEGFQVWGAKIRKKGGD